MQAQLLPVQRSVEIKKMGFDGQSIAAKGGSIADV